MSVGYIYCFSNESMPGILKIGMTERTPEERLKEANGSDTWRPPTPYKIEIAKKVSYPVKKEKTIHNILENERVNSKREFFKISVERINQFFDLMDGELWYEEIKTSKNLQLPTNLEFNIGTIPEINSEIKPYVIPEINFDVILENHPEKNYILKIIKKQDNILASKIDKIYRPFAKRLMSQYDQFHSFNEISEKYKDDLNKLKWETKEVLNFRHGHMLYLMNEFNSIE